MQKGTSVPAWLLCEDIMTKMKEALVDEALTTLHNEIDSGRIKLDAKWINTESQTEALERDMFLINNLIEQAPNMLQVQNDYIMKNENAGAKMDAEKIEKLENVKRLSMAVSYISVLMRNATVIDDWIKTVEQLPQDSDSKSILKQTLDDERLDLVKFVLKTKPFNDGIFSEEELSILRSLDK
jgi:hypothetical protein